MLRSVAGGQRPVNAGRASSSLVSASVLCWRRCGEECEQHHASRVLRRHGDQRAATQACRRGNELAAHCPGAATPALRTTDEVVPLTRRERELALLAADGLSTKEIAERLVLSDRTVQNHLNHAYEKLGVSGRRELRKALRLPTTRRPG